MVRVTQDLTNAKMVDDLLRTIRELKVERDVEQLTAYRMSERVTELTTQNVMLRGALTEAKEKVVDSFGVGYDAEDIDRWETILANPSPLAEAMRAVVSAAVADHEALNKWYHGASGKKIDEEQRKANADLSKAVDAYRALRDSMPPGYGHADGGE